MIRLSIVIPVHNVEDYIRPCLESVFQQGLDDAQFEVILVDDGCEDESFSRIADLLEQHPNATVLKQAYQGPSVARNRGVDAARGEYVLFVDSDDYLIEGTIGPQLRLAEEAKADLLVAEYQKLCNEELVDNPTASTAGAVQQMTGRQLFASVLQPQQCYVWRTLYCRQFLAESGIRFIPGIFFEDIPFTVACYLKAGACVKTGVPVYVYRQRRNSVVASIDMSKLKDMNEVVARLWRMKQEAALAPREADKLADVIFATFSIAVWYMVHDCHLLQHRREFAADLLGRVPDLRFTHGLKQRLVSALFRLWPSAYVWGRALFR